MVESKSKETKSKAPKGKEAKSKETKSDAKAVKEPKKIFNETLTAVWIDKLLDKLRKGYFSDFLEKNEKWLVTTGLFGLYIAAVLGLLASFILPIRYNDADSASIIGLGVVWFFLCIIIHYTAWKFLPALSHLIQNTPTKLSSKSFLDSLALLAGIAGVISLLGGLLLWIKTSSFDSFIAGILIFILCEYILSLCLVPKNLNIEISEKTSVGEEFLGLISFFMKGFLKLIPVIFGAAIILIIIKIIELLFVKYEFTGQMRLTFSEIGNLTTLAILPVTGYFLFLLYYFLIDFAMAVLSIPGKIDAVKDAKK